MLTIMCGIPGSGKSTHLTKVLYNHGNIMSSGNVPVILSLDDFRRVLTGRDYHGPAEDSVWSHVKTAARVLLRKDYRVIIDGTHLTLASRKSWIMIAKEVDVDICCTWMNIPFATCIARNKTRDRVVPDDVISRMCSVFVLPLVSEGFSSIFEIREDGSERKRT